ncbi:hypothetical protein C9J27_06035 [Photobacterium kishitanii]|uniref:Uncharacterized protein n=2 Tax=Photobacterium kishitanii TaxID=318456 RepID=A0A2T3KLX1_9GAMM|nr:hypothetical protein C9J27_06035 [Photobacterium kishitanii]
MFKHYISAPAEKFQIKFKDSIEEITVVKLDQAPSYFKQIVDLLESKSIHLKTMNKIGFIDINGTFKNKVESLEIVAASHQVINEELLANSTELTEEALVNLKNSDGSNKRFVLCASNIFNVFDEQNEFIGSLTLNDCQHYGKSIQSIVFALINFGFTIVPDHQANECGEGFIDNYGKYLTRSEAYTIAKLSDQPFNDTYTLSGNLLDSSCIRHIAK